LTTVDEVAFDATVQANHAASFRTRVFAQKIDRGRS